MIDIQAPLSWLKLDVRIMDHWEDKLRIMFYFRPPKEITVEEFQMFELVQSEEETDWPVLRFPDLSSATYFRLKYGI